MHTSTCSDQYVLCTLHTLHLSMFGLLDCYFAHAPMPCTCVAVLSTGMVKAARAGLAWSPDEGCLRGVERIAPVTAAAARNGVFFWSIVRLARPPGARCH